MHLAVCFLLVSLVNGHENIQIHDATREPAVGREERDRNYPVSPLIDLKTKCFLNPNPVKKYLYCNVHIAFFSNVVITNSTDNCSCSIRSGVISRRLVLVVAAAAAAESAVAITVAVVGQEARKKM